MIHTTIQELSELLARLMKDAQFLKGYYSIKDCLIQAALSNNTIFVTGNGGSASQAQHFTAELVGRYQKERRAIRALALHCDTSILTAWSNDYSYETAFSRQLEALGIAGDVLVALTTSGNSKNICSVLKTAQKKKITTVGFLGNDGGEARKLCTFSVVVPSTKTEHIQEIHLVLIHALSEEIENTIV